MLPWKPISNRPSTKFYKQEMEFYFARQGKALAREREASPKLTQEKLEHKVQKNILEFKKRLERGRTRARTRTKLS